VKIAAYVLGGILGIVVLTWIFQGNDFYLYKVFAPRQEAVRRQVFEQSRAFNQGMVQELENMQFKYAEENDEGAKTALADIVIHRASGYNMDDDSVSQSLRSFVQSLKDERTGTRERSFK
jgi:hypothetical protein